MKNQELYEKLAYQTSEQLTRAYSSSFSSAIILLDKRLRKHIYAVYGLARVADEIVDSFRPVNMKQQLNLLEDEVFVATKTGFSSNLVVHSFGLTARKYKFDESEIKDFFNSMRVDIAASKFSEPEYQSYIHGSAEVIGLMCLRIFCDGKEGDYKSMSNSAKRLGAAFQKINFLRDITDDNKLGRMYFPGIDFKTFNNAKKLAVVYDVKNDLRVARKGLMRLPYSSRYGVLLALYYYEELLRKLQHTPAGKILSQRQRIPNIHKLWLFLIVRIQKISHT